MKKLLLALVAFFALSFGAFAAVNLNTATKDELDTVKGIGPVKAQAIIDYRQAHGPFKSVDELKNVRGFGEKTVAKMRSELTVTGATTVRSEPVKTQPAQPAPAQTAPTRTAPAQPEQAEVKKHGKDKAAKEDKAGKQDEAKQAGDEKKGKKDKQSKKDKKKAQKEKKDKKKGKDSKQEQK